MDYRRHARQAIQAALFGMPADRWDAVAEAIAASRRTDEDELRSDDDGGELLPLLPELRSRGFVRLPGKLADPAGVRAYFEVHPVQGGQSASSCDAITIAEARRCWPLACYRPEVVLRAPGLIDAFNDPDLLSLVEGYLGCVPTLYSLNAWWSFEAAGPSPAKPPVFHRDNDDWRHVTLFTYLTDVTDDTGPHQVIPGSHTAEGLRRAAPAAWSGAEEIARTFALPPDAAFSADMTRAFESCAETLTGPAGTMLLVNTLALHRGLVPRRAPRLMVWARYGLGSNAFSLDQFGGPAARWTVATSIPDDARHRYINRLLFV